MSGEQLLLPLNAGVDGQASKFDDRYPIDSIRTFGGGYVRYLEPGINDPPITIEQIARGLAANVRFAGQAKNPFTVAGHSAWVALVMLHDGCSQLGVLAGLLHDASEAFMRDLPTPLKHGLGLDGYLEIEKMVQHRINCALGGPFACADLLEAQQTVVPFYDTASYQREAIDGFPDSPPVSTPELDELAARLSVVKAFQTGVGVWKEFESSAAAFAALYQSIVDTAPEQFAAVQAYVQAREQLSGPLGQMV